jgi:cytochrome oxidase Cu insertion factor (SCO1/SenC/PrrC family)
MIQTPVSPTRFIGAGRGMLVALLSIVFMAGTGWLVAELVRPPAAIEAPAPLLDKASLLALIDHQGAPLEPAALDKPATVVFFGYTYCPDICPLELATMAAALDRLGPAADGVGAFFVSVDPERDTPEHLAGYVDLFHPRITGLTGEPEAIAAAAGAFRAYYERVEHDDGTYTVDHFARTLVLDQDGRLAAAIPFDSQPEVLEAALRPLLETSP